MTGAGGEQETGLVAVTGAGGKLGRAVVEGLLALMPAEAILALTREPAKVSDLADRGVAVRAADFADEASLTVAMAGARQVLVVSVDRLGEAGRRLHRTAIAAARASGAHRVLYTSHMGTHATSPFNDHFAAERDLAADGLPFTSLRHGFYAESALHLVGPLFESGEIRTPADGPVSWTARADLAEADATILAENGSFDGLTPPLVAPQSVTMAELADIASNLCNRPVRRVVVADEAWRDEKAAAGMPPAMIEAVLGMYRAARNGEFASGDPTLENLLGRPATSVRDVLAAALKAQAAPA